MRRSVIAQVFEYNIYDNAEYLGNENNPYLALIKALDTDITSCNIHEDAKIIANSAFENCSSLTSITIPDSVTSIGDSAFWGCSRLTSVTIGNGVARIESSALYECWDLADIYYSGTEAEWDKIIKHKKWNNNTGNYTLHCSDVDIEK